jgi:hypothetical protein
VGDSVAYTAQIDEAGNTYEELIAAGGPRSIVAGIAQAGALAIGFALILISQAALKAGLTSRFLGFIGIAVGAFYGLGALFTALGLGGQFSPVVLEVFWLGALALIFVDRWPNGRGPAWETGEARPWPTAQAQREAYERRVESRRDQIESGPSDPPASGGNGSGAPAPGSRKRKKKRR